MSIDTETYIKYWLRILVYIPHVKSKRLPLISQVETVFGDFVANKKIVVGFEVFTAVTMKNAGFRDVGPHARSRHSSG
jgi:hypothetical protein